MSALPDVLKVGTIQTAENMKIETMVLDPQTITDNTAVFQLPKAGILDQGSFLQLGVTTSSATDDMFFPLATGIHGLIQSVSLKIGNQVVASNTQYPFYTTAKRQFDTPEHRAYVDMVKSGTCGDRFAVGESGRLTYRDLTTTVNATPANSTQFVPFTIRPTADESTTPLFSVPLSTLIPMMVKRSLPLFAIKENVYLEITFNTQKVDADIGTICCRRAGSSVDPTIKPAKTQIKFIYDSLYYTDDAMEKVMAQSASADGLPMLYEDQIVTDSTIPASGVSTGTHKQVVEREIAVAGRTVRSILIHEDNVDASAHQYLGKYVSRDTKIPAALNFRINDQRIYDRDLVSSTRKYDELAQVFGRPLMMPSQLYSMDSDTDKSNTLEPLNQQSTYVGKVEGHQSPAAASTTPSTDTDIRATSHFEGIDLTTTGFNELGNGKKIGVKPIRVLKTYTRTSDDDKVRSMKAFASVERVMLLRRGEVTISA